jgi:hypothetical protein
MARESGNIAELLTSRTSSYAASSVAAGESVWLQTNINASSTAVPVVFLNLDNLLTNPLVLSCCLAVFATGAILFFLFRQVDSSETSGGECATQNNADSTKVREVRANQHSISQALFVCISRACDREQYKFASCLLDSVSVIKRVISAMPDLRPRRQRDGSLISVLRDPRTDQALRSVFWTELVRRHPYFGLWFHNAADEYSSQQRCLVLFAAIFSVFFVNAMALGRWFPWDNDTFTAVVSAWISICVEIFVASLFARASALVVKERLERAALSLIHVRLPKLEQLDEGAVRAAFVWNIVAHFTVCFIIFVSVLTCLGAVHFLWNILFHSSP